MGSFIRLSLYVLCACSTLLPSPALAANSERDLYRMKAGLIDQIKGAMLGSIRTSWEQGTAAAAILEIDDCAYSVFGPTPFSSNGDRPVSTLRLAFSAAARQTPDGRLSQQINDASDGAALDGASAGSVVLLGSYTDPARRDFWQTATDAQLNYLLNTAPRTSTGAISHRGDSKQYWNDGVYMGAPFIAAYGAVTCNQTLVQMAFDECRRYRDALLIPGPTGNLWAHIYSDDTNSFSDKGLWSTGNAWAALGILRVQVTIMKSPFASSMTSQIDTMNVWIKEILDGTFAAIKPNNLIPNYITGGSDFGDAASSAALASVAYRSAKLFPNIFGPSYTSTAAKIRDAVLDGVKHNDLGMLTPVVDPLNWDKVGTLSTEAQAFGLMMMAAWRDYLDL